MTEQQDFQKRMKRIESLVEGIQTAADPALRGRAVELVELLMELHGAGLERLLTILADTGEPGLAQIDQLAADPLVASLMLLYGLHPDDLETRVGRALEKVRPYLKSHGGNVQLLAIEENSLRLRLEGSCHGCPSSAMTLKLAIEEALHEFAPDATEIIVEGVVPERSPAAFMPLGKIQPLASTGSEPESTKSEASEPAAVNT
jgi:Fe-S cluster biogenesis protein NfuA